MEAEIMRSATDLSRLHDDFPVLSRTVGREPTIYLDSAATSLTPTPVIDAVVRYYTEHSANIHRGKHMLSDEASQEYENARDRTAAFIHARNDEIVFVKNATEGMNIISAGLPLTSAAKVLMPVDAHHSAMLPWRTRATVDYLPRDASGALDIDACEAQLERTRPEVLVLSHCSNLDGRYVDVTRLAKAGHDVGARVVVDAAQSVPHRPIDVSALGADFLVFSAHKMLGPTGIGVLYGRAEQLEQMSPPFIGGGTVDWVDEDVIRPRRLPHRLEAGTPDIAAAYGLAAAIDYLARLGAQTVTDHDAELAREMYGRAAERNWMKVVGAEPTPDRTAILSFVVPGLPKLDDLARALSDSYGVMCRSGTMCAQLGLSQFGAQALRMSAYVYNTIAEIDRAFDALDRIAHYMLPA
jgi:cysteine desulfurase/selenocysteine lyase